MRHVLKLWRSTHLDLNWTLEKTMHAGVSDFTYTLLISVNVRFGNTRFKIRFPSPAPAAPLSAGVECFADVTRPQPCHNDVTMTSREGFFENYDITKRMWTNCSDVTGENLWDVTRKCAQNIEWLFGNPQLRRFSALNILMYLKKKSIGGRKCTGQGLRSLIRSLVGMFCSQCWSYSNKLNLI